MTYKKRTIIEQAYTEIGMGSYAYDATPEDLQDGLIRLNALMAEWASYGAQTGWPSANSEYADDLDADSNLPSDAVRGVICALAMEIAPSVGKQVSMQTQRAAREGKRLMVRKNQEVPQMQMDATSIPLGAGWKRYGGPINLPASDNDILEGEYTDGDDE